MLLTATHISTGQSAKFDLDQTNFHLGRSTNSDGPDKLGVDFDPTLSRRLAVLSVQSGALLVERDQSRYPLFYEGEEQETFQLLPGQRFSSGETVFELHEEAPQTLTVQVMERVNHGNAEKILQVLLGFQNLLNRWHKPEELTLKSVDLLKQLLPESQVVFFSLGPGGQTIPLTPSTLKPSKSLIAECLKEKLPAYHLWNDSIGLTQPTQFGDESWALAAPILSSRDRLILYAVGRQSQKTPGELERSALALVAQIMSQNLESRNSLILATQVEAESKANQKLRILLETIERSLSLQKEEGLEETFADGAMKLTGAREARFVDDLSPVLQQGEHSKCYVEDDTSYLLMSFEHSWPKGVVCENPKDRPFLSDQEDWLVALMGFAETVLENRALHDQVHSSLTQLKENQAQMVRSSQWAAAGRLAANAAHELNTPLGAIKLSAETAIHFSKDGPKPALDGLDIILRSVDRCRQVTERFLVYSRPQVEKTPEIFSLTSVVDDSLSSVSPFLQTRNITVERDLPAEIEVFGNNQDCYWAITNVLKNAIDSVSDEDGREQHISISAKISDGSARLIVSDSGPGIPDSLAERIFEPFFSTKKIGEGNGLGLAISRRNLRSWGGDIRVLSQDQGASFQLTFPLNPIA